MSTDAPTGDAGTPQSAGRPVAVVLGSHLDGRRPGAVDACDDLMREVPAVVHLARYSTGVCDFALDSAPHTVDSTTLSAEERQLVDRDVVHVMTYLDAQLRPARSGNLLRIVLHTVRGALFVLQVRREQYLVAMVHPEGVPAAGAEPGPSGVQAADVALSRLANRLRNATSQPALDYGGWLRFGVLADAVEHGETRTTKTPRARMWAVDSSYADLATICRDHLDPQSLHYAAVCRPGQVEATADLLDDDRLEPFADTIGPGRRRAFYGLVGQQIDVLLRMVVRAAHPALGSRVRRLVLDVEEGALYCYPVGLDRYLFAVTLAQEGIASSDERVALLSRELSG
ncbi:hypothetical protein ABT336_19550 [Micromonospora sp. NPDC000207]|uniref:hypothetical protein n=1 Tax=Micromonospora sp. NPDC000207 TaxID=3154246 RepID=UPI0033167A5B